MKHFIRRMAAFLLTLLLLVSSASALTVEQAIEVLKQHYYYDIPPQAYEAEDLQTLFSILDDPYTYYMDEEDYRDFLDSVEDTVDLVGIGVSIQYTNEGILVIEPLVGGSAYEAGIKAGDLIVAVDGVSCVPGTENHRALIVGEEGTEVTVTILRDGVTTDYVLKRCRVVLPNTVFTVVDGHIGRIDCSSFGSDTGSLFVEGVKANSDAVDRWLVDLRGNTGGYSGAAVDALGSLAGPGIYLYLQNNQEGLYYNISYEDKSGDQPVIVLVDHYTASASEAFTAGVRDLGIGISVGSRTYGKGTAQVVCNNETHPDYFENDAVKLTAYRFYSANAITNDKIGVIPTLVVSDDMAEAVAQALCGTGRKDVSNQLMLEVGDILLTVDLEVTEPEVLAALFEALTPYNTLWIYEGDVSVDYNVTRAAQRLGIEYNSRWFSDVSGSVFKRSINALATYGILHGDESGNFHPEETMTRGEVCAMLAEALSIDGVEGMYFTDVSAEHPYAAYINGLAAAGLINGMGDGTFRPENLMTRQEYCALLRRVLCSLNLHYRYAVPEIDTTALEEMRAMGFHGWAQESAALLDLANALRFTSEEPDPAGAILREEAATILYGVLLSGGILQ